MLVRIPATGTDWAGRLPPVPGGRVLTVSVGDPALLGVPADDLVSAGYRIVGLVPGGTATMRVDVLVPAALRTGEVAWWRALLAGAERVFDLRMGPVQHVLGPELAAHLAGRSAGHD